MIGVLTVDAFHCCNGSSSVGFLVYWPKSGEIVPHRLLAHAAMEDVGVVEKLRCGEADRATLAAAGDWAVVMALHFHRASLII